MVVSKSSGFSAVLSALLVVLLGLVPLLCPVYWVMLITEILVMGLFSLSFNLLFGTTGLLSFGQAGFLGVGAYVSALLITNGVSSISLILFSSVAAAAATALVVGFFCVRRDEIFFAMLSLAFGMMLFTVAHNWREVTGGSDGLPVFSLPPLVLGSWRVSLFSPVSVYYFVLVWAVLGALFLWRVERSPFGLMLQAVRENKERVAFSGGNVRTLRLMAFVIAGAVSGLAGFLMCLFNRMAAPDMLHWSASARPVLMTVLGGSGTFLGPAVGAAIFFFLEHWVTSFTENWMVVLGAILIPVVLFFPEGIWGTVWKHLTGHGRSREPDHDEP